MTPFNRPTPSGKRHLCRPKTVPLAGKGFGKPQPGKKDQQGKKGKGSKGKKTVVVDQAAPKQVPVSATLKQAQNASAAPSVEDRYKEAVGRKDNPNEPSFEERLAALKASSAGVAKEKVAEEDKGLFARSEDAYTNPPSLLESLAGPKEADPDKVNPLGDNRLAIVAGTVVLGAILIFGSVGGDSFISPQPDVSAEEKTKLEAQLDGFKATLKADGDNVDALEGAAVTYANLKDYRASEELLTRLAQVKATDPDVWRLLGETRSAMKDWGKAAAAYEEALKLADTDLEILKGYSGSLVAAGKPSEAVAQIKAVAERVRTAEASAPPARAVVATVPPRADPSIADPSSADPSIPDAPIPDAPMPPAGGDEAQPQEPLPDSASSGASESSSDQAVSESASVGQDDSSRSSSSSGDSASSLGRTGASPLELDLLLAKVYSQWRGHTSDALATYDSIIQKYPSDFRGYLAKGVLLRQEGRKSDADRAFMQARFMAPPALRSIVDKVAAPEDPI